MFKNKKLIFSFCAIIVTIMILAYITFTINKPKIKFTQQSKQYSSITIGSNFLSVNINNQIFLIYANDNNLMIVSGKNKSDISIIDELAISIENEILKSIKLK